MTFDLREARAVLARTPAALGALLDGLPASWLDANEGPDTFSPLDVLGHLISGEEHDWIPRLRMVLADGESRPFEPFDRFGFRERLAGVGLAARLGRFDELRRRSLADLDRLVADPSCLDRRGRHPALGSVTARELLATWVVHDLSHLAQIARTMAGRYRGEVGPWTVYLPILAPRAPLSAPR